MYRNDRIKVMGAEKVIPLVGILGVAGLASHYYTEMEKERNVSPLRNTSFAQPTAQQLEEIEAIKAQAIEEYKDTNEEPINTWDEWLPSEPYGPQYFENFMDDEFEEENPFKPNGRIITGKADWINTSKLKLIDYDWSSKDSGGLKLIVQDGFQVLLKISTDNAGYFYDDVSEDGSSTTTLYDYIDDLGRTAKKGNGWTSTKSAVSVPLNGDDGDYLSVDIDSEHSGIRAFRVCSLGRCFSDDSENPDDGVYVKLQQINRRNPNYDPTKFSAESYIFDAPTPANVGRIAKAWKGITTALSVVNPLKRFGIGVGKGTKFIKGTSVVKGQVAIGRQGKNLGKVESAVAITDTIAKKPSILLGKGVSKVGDDGRSTLQSGYVVKRGGQFIEGSSDAGAYTQKVFKLRNGDELIRVADVGASGGSGFGNVINLRNAGRTVLVAGTGATIGAIFTITDMIPGLLGDGFEDLACSLTGSCCEEQCEDSDNPNCVEECKEAADDKAVKFGGLVVVGIIGLALVFRGGKSEKSAEEYMVMRRG